MMRREDVIDHGKRDVNKSIVQKSTDRPQVFGVAQSLGRRGRLYIDMGNGEMCVDDLSGFFEQSHGGVVDSVEELDLKKKITIMIAIMAAVLFVALNQTIIGTALPMIVADIGGIHYFNWVFTAYMLATSVTAILVGKLSDIYGRKPFILIGLAIFTLGSFLNGTSNTMVQLIAYRAVQGFGAGMIMSTSFTAVGDLFTPRERGRWQGLMGASFGIASVFGPTMGGYIVDHFDWHWVFWIFLPFGIVAFGLIWRLFPVTEQNEREPIDFLGAVLLAGTIVPLLLAFSWAGTDYAWSSPIIIGLFIASAVALSMFIVVELKMVSPILPLDLFRNSVFTISNLVGFMMGMGMFGTIMFMPFFIQGVMGTSATQTGFIMMSMTLSNVAGSTISGQIMTITGKYKRLALVGLTLMGSGLAAASFLHAEIAVWKVVANMIVFGFGLGTCFPIFTITVQNTVPHRLLGVATSSAQLFRQMGGTMGVAIFGSVMNGLMGRHLQGMTAVMKELPAEIEDEIGDLTNPQVLMDHEQLAQIQQSLPERVQDVYIQLIGHLREGLSYALNGVFLTGASVMVLAFILTLFLKELKLRTSNQ